MPFWGVVMGVVNIIMGVARGRYHQLPVGVAMVPEGSLKKLEPMHRALAYKENILYMVEHNSEIKIKLTLAAHARASRVNNY